MYLNYIFRHQRKSHSVSVQTHWSPMRWTWAKTPFFMCIQTASALIRWSWWWFRSSVIKVSSNSLYISSRYWIFPFSQGTTLLESGQRPLWGNIKGTFTVDIRGYQYHLESIGLRTDLSLEMVWGRVSFHHGIWHQPSDHKLSISVIKFSNSLAGSQFRKTVIYFNCHGFLCIKALWLPFHPLYLMY